jgi:hypothetical protein
LIPKDVLDAQMKRKGDDKYIPTKEELVKIKDAGLWIPKDNFSYNYALQIIEVGHLLDKNYIDRIREYISNGRKLNFQKEFCQQWIVTRGNINPDEAKSYFNLLYKTKEMLMKMKKAIDKELKKYQ